MRSRSACKGSLGTLAELRDRHFVISSKQLRKTPEITDRLGATAPIG